MGIFSRIGNMTKGKVNAVLDDMENPIELLDQKLRDEEKALNEAKIETARVLGGFKETEKKLEEAKTESAKWDAMVARGVQNSEALKDGIADPAIKEKYDKFEALAREALANKLAADKKAAELTAVYESSKVKSAKLKENIAKLESEIEKDRSYRDEAAARLANAEASEKVNEILSNTQTKSNSISKDSIERKIEKKEAQAEGLGELVEPSLDDKFADLEAPDLDAELAKYRSK